MQSVKAGFFGEKLHEEIPESRFLAPSPQDIVNAVCSEYGITEDGLLVSRRGTTNEPRSVAIQLFRSLRGDTLACIAQTFGIRTYSTVSSILLRLQSRLKGERALRIRLDSLRKKILASQEQT